MTSVRTYEVERSFIVLSHLGIWLFAAMAVLSLLLPLIDDTSRPNPVDFLAVCTVLFAGFIGLCAASYFFLRKARTCSLTVDEQGLWKVQIGREKGLVPWNSVKSVREHQFRQSLELLGFSGERLLEIEYQLCGFDELRAVVLSKIPKADRFFPQRYERRAIYVPFHIGFTLLVSAGIWWFISAGQIWLAVGLLVMLVLGIQDFFTSITALTIWRDHLTVEFPLRKLEIWSADIKALRFADLHNQAARVPQLELELVSGKIIKLEGLGVDETELYRQLSGLTPTHT